MVALPYTTHTMPEGQNSTQSPHPVQISRSILGIAILNTYLLFPPRFFYTKIMNTPAIGGYDICRKSTLFPHLPELLRVYHQDALPFNLDSILLLQSPKRSTYHIPN